MHISIATVAVMNSRGWFSPTQFTMVKTFTDPLRAGMLGDGSREILVRFDDIGRYVEIIDGFAVSRDFDSRDFVGRPEALADAIEAVVAKLFD